jgi:hypothetical protein
VKTASSFVPTKRHPQRLVRTSSQKVAKSQGTYTQTHNELTPLYLAIGPNYPFFSCGYELTNSLRLSEGTVYADQ